MDTHYPEGSEDVEEPTKNMVVRIQPSLYKRVQEIAADEQRSLSAEVRWLMQRRVEEKEAA